MTVIPDGRVLRTLRHEHKLTVEELARLSRVSAKTILRIENGQTRGCFTHTLKLLAAALGCELADLVQAPPTLPGGQIPYDHADDPRPITRKYVAPPTPGTLLPVPLRADTVEILRATYRAERDRAFITTAQVLSVKPLTLQERVAIGAAADGVGARFELAARTGHTTTRVMVYSRKAQTTLVFRDAIESRGWVDLIVRVDVVKYRDEHPTVGRRSELSPNVFQGWQGFTWPSPDPPEPWALVVQEAEAVPANGRVRDLDRRKKEPKVGKLVPATDTVWPLRKLSVTPKRQDDEPGEGDR